MAAYKGFTEAQAKAHKKYMESVATIQIRTTAERRDIIKAHAESLGESVNGFINRAIDSQIERDSFARASDPATAPGAASLGGNADNVSGRG